jgi:hypothetical protein
MRTKTLLGLAVLTAGAVTAVAQSNVYSLNIVGYCNVPAKGGYSYMSNPLDNGNNNANTLFPNPNPDPSGTSGQLGPWDGSSLQEWTGVGFKVSVFDSLTPDTTTGFTDVSGSTPVPAPVFGSGKGFLLNNQGGYATNGNQVTFVGNVRGPGTNTMNLPAATTPYALGSMLPLAGNVTTAIGFNNPNPDPSGTSGQLGPLDGCSIQTLKVNASGQATGYDVSVFDSLTDDTTTGFTDVSGTTPKPIPQIAIGQGFFLAKASSGTFVWTQILTNSP